MGFRYYYNQGKCPVCHGEFKSCRDNQDGLFFCRTTNPSDAFNLVGFDPHNFGMYVSKAESSSKPYNIAKKLNTSHNKRKAGFRAAPSAPYNTKLAKRIDKTYRWILDLPMFKLAEAHKKHLQEVRHLPEDIIEKLWFRSCIGSRNNYLGSIPDGYCFLPGMKIENGHWVWDFHSYANELLIPIINQDGLITGLQRRNMQDDTLDKRKGKKYSRYYAFGGEKTFTLNSGKKVTTRENKNALGEPGCTVFLPPDLNQEDFPVVYISEGLLKSSIIGYSFGAPCIGVPGSNWSTNHDSIFKALQKIAALYNKPSVTDLLILITPDANSFSPPEKSPYVFDPSRKLPYVQHFPVVTQLQYLTQMLLSWHIPPQNISFLDYEHWRNKNAPDPDEVLHYAEYACDEQTLSFFYDQPEVHAILDYPAVKDLAKLGIYTKDFHHNIVSPPRKPYTFDPRLGIPKNFDPSTQKLVYNREDRVALYNAIKNRSGVYLDTSGTGSGKSTAIGLLAQNYVDDTFLYYCSSSSRDITCPELLENTIGMPVRTPTDLLNSDKTIAQTANCSPADFVRRIRSELIDWQNITEDTSICSSCPASSTCLKQEGSVPISYKKAHNKPPQTTDFTVGFRKQFKDFISTAAKNNSLATRCHVNSLLGIENLNISGKGTSFVVVDEPSQALPKVDNFSITTTKLRQIAQDLNLYNREYDNPTAFEAFSLKFWQFIDDLESAAFTKENRYGLSDTSSRKALEFLLTDYEDTIIAASDSDPNPITVPGFSFLSLLLHRQPGLAKLDRFNFKHAFVDPSALGETMTEHLPLLLDVLHDKRRGSLSIVNTTFKDPETKQTKTVNKIQVSLYPFEKIDKIKSADTLLLLDATASIDKVARKLALSPKSIFQIEAATPKYKAPIRLINFQTSVATGNSRSADTTKALYSLLDNFYSSHASNLGLTSKNQIAVIDWVNKKPKDSPYTILHQLSAGDNGGIGSNALFNDERKVKVCFIFGLPKTHLGSLAAQYQVETGNTIDPAKPTAFFGALAEEEQQEALIQYRGRLREYLRDDQILTILVSPFESADSHTTPAANLLLQPGDVEPLKLRWVDIDYSSAPSGDKFFKDVETTYTTLVSNDIKPTVTNVAKALTVSKKQLEQKTFYTWDCQSLFGFKEIAAYLQDFDKYFITSRTFDSVVDSACRSICLWAEKPLRPAIRSAVVNSWDALYRYNRYKLDGCTPKHSAQLKHLRDTLGVQMLPDSFELPQRRYLNYPAFSLPDLWVKYLFEYQQYPAYLDWQMNDQDKYPNNPLDWDAYYHLMYLASHKLQDNADQSNNDNPTDETP